MHQVIVVVESPYAGETVEDVAGNERYVRAIMRALLLEGLVPFASHALYTLPGVLDDCNSRERGIGILAGFRMRHVASRTIAYTDLGISRGMEMGVEHARELGQPVKFRRLEGWS